MQNNTLDKLISAIGKLPGLGPRSARRIVLHLIKDADTLMLPLAKQMHEVAKEIKICEECGNVDTVSPCNICTDERRDDSLLCIVETISDLWAIERYHFFKGKYHILGGTLSIMDGRPPEALRFEPLKNKIAAGHIKEVIIATNATLEGQTTSHYLLDLLEPYQIKTSHLAYGIPIGAELDYMDEGTLNLAFKTRQAF